MRFVLCSIICLLISTSSSYKFSLSKKSVNSRFSPHYEAQARRTTDENDGSAFVDFAATLRKCRFTKDFEPAIRQAEKALLLRPMSPSILTGVIKVFGESGQLGRAVSLLKIMREDYDIAPNEYHLGALITACRRCGQWEMGVALYSRMESLKVRKNTIICNNMISTLGDAFQWESVFGILREMDELGIQKDIVTYSSAITACVRAGEWERALTIYRMMEGEGVRPNTITLNAVLSACARGRQVKLALDLFCNACRSGIAVDTISYSVLIKLCGDINEFEVGLYLFEAMGDESEEKEQERDRDQLQHITNVRGDKHEREREIDSDRCEGTSGNVGSVSSRGASSSSSSSTLRLPHYSSDEFLSSWNSPTQTQSQFSAEYVRDVLSTCKRVPRDTGCFNSIITCCERTGQWEVAVDVLHRMLGSSRYRLRPDSKTYSAAISCCGKVGEWEEAYKIFKLIPNDGVLKDTAVYNAMIAALQLAAQRKLFDETDKVQSEGSGKGRVLSTSSEPSGGVSSEQLFEFAQIIYAEGLADGKLQQFAYSASFTARQREGVDGVSLEPLVRKDSKKRENRGGKVEGAVVTSPIDTIKQNFLMIEDNSVIKKMNRIEESSKNDVEERSSQGSVAGRRSEHESVAIQGRSAVTSTTRTAAPVSISPVDRSDSASMTSPQSIAGTPRVLDLHRCPLLVAKTALDYELKQIRYMLSSPLHDVPLGDHDAVMSGGGEGVGVGDVGTMSSTYSRLNRRPSSTALGVEIGSREVVASPVRTSNGNASSKREERRSHRSKRPSKKSTITSTTDGAAVDRSNSPHPTSQLNSVMEDLIENKTLVEDVIEERGTRIRSPVRFLECGQDLHIITGRGRHVNSSGTRGVLRSAMKNYLLENYKIAAHSMPGNDGCLVISRRSIDAWIRRTSS